MEKIVVSKRTQKREFFKVNGHLSVMNDSVKESWFNAYWAFELGELCSLFPNHFIEIIDDDIDKINDNHFYVDFDMNETEKK